MNGRYSSRIKKVIILTLQNEPSRTRALKAVQHVRDSDLKHLPLQVVFGMDGSQDEIPSSLLGGRWNDDLAHWEGSQATCYSHLFAITCAYTSSGENDLALILEDDTVVNKRILHYLDRIDGPDEFDFMHLSYWDSRCSPSKQEQFSENVAKIVRTACTGMFSYLAQPRRLLPKLINSMPFTCEVDNFISVDRRESFDTYCIHHQPQLSRHDSTESIRGICDLASWERLNFDTSS